ncbi:hypothetical protein AAFF_G00075300 [Aldrovandia affinis]|uniref:Uncharacterized protein n=1 Tax=Aldrovandia affinis TaxID=143900 RepID=A0AAD7RYA0_9TELE|nr:hypothetical protein AAFF_G00075300 [Aldrovandia affinis]
MTSSPSRGQRENNDDDDGPLRHTSLPKPAARALPQSHYGGSSQRHTSHQMKRNRPQTTTHRVMFCGDRSVPDQQRDLVAHPRTQNAI